MYSVIPSGTFLSELIDKVEVQHDQMRSLERSTIALGPTLKPVGLIHNCTDYAVIGDLHQVVPAISAEIIRRRG